MSSVNLNVIKSSKDESIRFGAHESEVEDDDEEHLKIIQMKGYQFSDSGEIIYFSLAIFTGFLSVLFFFWFPLLAIKLRYKHVPMDQADYVLVIPAHNDFQFVPVEVTSTKPLCEAPHLFSYMPYRPIPVPNNRDKMIIFRNTRFLFDPNESGSNKFERIRPLTNVPAEQIKISITKGISNQYLDKAQKLFGLNQQVVIIKSIPSMLMSEVFHPFFVFQIYSVILWCFEAYFIFAMCILIIATISIVTTLMDTRRRWIAMRDLAKFQCSVTVLRESQIETISSVDLVPGDIIVLPSQGIVSADIGLLDGSVVVNEAMLTGESVPVIKSSILLPSNPEATVSLGLDDRTTLFAATKILQLKPSKPGGKVLGIVLRTGYSTTKGGLLLSMMFPRPSSFKFEEQSFKFIAALFCLALVGFVISVVELLREGATTSLIIIRGLDLITIALPPALPLAMSIGTNFALLALRSKKIFCISPARINGAGKVQTMCFDKTGTLTEEGMELKGAQPVTPEGKHFTHFQKDLVGKNNNDVQSSELNSHEDKELQEEHSGISLVDSLADSNIASSTSDGQRNNSNAPLAPPSIDVQLQGDIRQAMACCHGLAKLDPSEINGLNEEGEKFEELIGDPLEIKIFNSTHATFVDSGVDLKGYLAIVTVPPPFNIEEATRTYGIKHRFEFSSKLQRMSVICEDLDSNALSVFIKGSPEIIRTLCIPSTIPSDFDQVLHKFTSQGYRVIAIGMKAIESIPKIEMDELRVFSETSIRFLGLIVLENKVKSETPKSLKRLHDALVRTIMVTGDNPLTAVTVAKECQLVEPGTRIFLSSVEEVPNENGLSIKKIKWIDTDDPSSELDPSNLQRLGAYKDQPYELAVTGPVFRLIEETNNLDEMNNICLNGIIFARMSPDQKACLVSHLQRLGLYTGMCGDGANDCAALKTAHIGISLSQTEASIAAPFTYLEPNISCVPMLLCEGRSSLITSFQLFRYMAMYSLIQFTAVVLCYFKGSVLSNWQYLIQDMWIVFPLTIFMGDTVASNRLTLKRPSGNLLSINNSLNIITHMLINLLFQYIVFAATSSSSGYVDLSQSPDFANDSHTWEATSLYYFSNFQYIIMAALFSYGAPWKKLAIFNFKFFIWWIVALITAVSLIFDNKNNVFFTEDDIMQPLKWRGGMFGLVIVNAIVSSLFEFFFYPRAVSKYKLHKRTAGGYASGFVFGRMKNVAGPNSKLYHRIRGAFEQGWTSLQSSSIQISNE